MIDTELEMFGDMWSAINSLYDRDVQSSAIESAFKSLKAFDLVLIKSEIQHYVINDLTFRGPPSVQSLVDNCEFKQREK